MPYLLLCAILMVLGALETQSYQLRYNDCSKPTSISNINVKTACDKEKTMNNVTTTFRLLQRKRETRLKGFKCQILKSDFLLYCGAFSHQKMLRTPMIDVLSRVTVNHCWEMVTVQAFTAPGSNHIEQLELGKENVLHVNSLGQLHPDNNVWCEGQSIKIGGSVVNEAIELTQCKIMLIEENFIYKGGRVEALGITKR